MAYANRGLVREGNAVSNPVIAADDSENTLAVWLDQRVGTNKKHLYARMFDKQGRPLPLNTTAKGDLKLDTIDASQIDSVDPADLLFDPITNKFVVVWAEKSTNAVYSWNVYMRDLTWNNTSLEAGDAIEVAVSGSLVERYPKVAVRYPLGAAAPNNATNQLIVTWQGGRGGNYPDSFFAVKARGYHSTASGITADADSALRVDQYPHPAVVVKTFGYTGCTKLDVAVSANGKVMFTWTTDQNSVRDAIDYDVYGRVYDIGVFSVNPEPVP